MTQDQAWQVFRAYVARVVRREREAREEVWESRDDMKKGPERVAAVRSPMTKGTSK